MALADQDNEEGRTAAHLAIKLIKKSGFVITVSTKIEEPQPAPAPRPPPSAYRPTTVPTTRAATRWEDVKKIVLDEAVQFMRTIDVLPRDIPIYGVQLVPAEKRGKCSCGHAYQRGEMISRGRYPVCARCVAERSRMRGQLLERRDDALGEKLVAGGRQMHPVRAEERDDCR